MRPQRRAISPRAAPNRARDGPGAPAEKNTHNAGELVISNRQHQRCIALVIRRVHIRARFKKDIQYFCTAVVCSVHQRRPAAVAFYVHIRARFEKDAENINVKVFITINGRPPQSRHAITVSCVDVRARTEKYAHDSGVSSIASGQHQRSFTFGVLCVHVRASFYQCLYVLKRVDSP